MPRIRIGLWTSHSDFRILQASFLSINPFMRLQQLVNTPTQAHLAGMSFFDVRRDWLRRESFKQRQRQDGTQRIKSFHISAARSTDSFVLCFDPIPFPQSAGTYRSPTIHHAVGCMASLTMVHESPCFCFVNEGAAKLYDHLVCTICQEIPSKDPVVSNCDHVFCNDCITKLCKSSSTSSWRCPNDRQRLYEWFPLDGVARQIWETVRVACPRKACAWQGDLGQYEHHHKIECTCTAIAETATAFYLQTEIKALKLEKSAWESDKRTLEDTARQLTERVEALQCQLAIPDIPKPKQMEKTAESTTQVLRRSTTQATTQDAMPTIPIVSLQGPEVKEMDDAVVKMHRLAKEGVSQRDRERMFSQMQALRARVTNSIKRSPQASSLVVSTELKMMAVAKTSEIFTRNQIKQMKKWHQQHRAMVLRP